MKKSLVFAFEQAEGDAWQKNKKNANPQSKEKDSFLAGLFRMLGVKK